MLTQLPVVWRAQRYNFREDRSRLPRKLPGGLKNQDQTLWCWASVAQYALALAGFTKPQCTIAKEHFSCQPGDQKSCCLDPPQCNERESLDDVLREQDCLARFEDVNGQFPREEVVEALENGELVAFLVWVDGSGHFVVANGLDGELVLLEDPNGPTLKQRHRGEVFGNDPKYDGIWEIGAVYWTKRPTRRFQC